MRSRAILLLVVGSLVVACNGGSESADQVAETAVFDFAVHDLCEWVTAEDITRIVSEAYATHGAAPIPSDFEQSASTGHPVNSHYQGCWWVSPSGADPGAEESIVGLIHAGPRDSYEKAGPIRELLQPHDGLSAGVQVSRPWPVPVGTHDDWIPGIEVRLLVDGHEESLEFWHMVPPGYEGDAVPMLTIADEILRLMAWTTVEHS